ncbi:MAG: diaminopimelate decarboxylase [Acidimicrobiia bacterium]
MNPIPLDLLPETATVHHGRLRIGGCDVADLVAEFGSPLFIYDEQHLIDRCTEAVAAFGEGVAYASKAFLCKAMARLAYEAGMDIDVATGGELFVALAGGVPADRIVMHGNNKTDTEITMALNAGVGRIVVDSFDEMDRLDRLVPDAAHAPTVLVRVNPGIEAHTHEYLRTGITDSKFGFPLARDLAAQAIERARSSESMVYRGIHAHIGSQVFDVTSYGKAMGALAPFIEASGAAEVSVGGGLGVGYLSGEKAPTISEWAEAIHRVARAHGIDARITAEPGRSIVAKAAVTAYTVGTIKDIPGVRTYLAVDGGMSDNPRPVLYGSGYEAFLVRDVAAPRERSFRIVGKHCESGDVIIHDAALPTDVSVGDIIGTPVTGAYSHSMGSNYNKVLRPAVVFVLDGSPRLVVERETYQDLVAHDVG